MKRWILSVPLLALCAVALPQDVSAQQADQPGAAARMTASAVQVAPAQPQNLSFRLGGGVAVPIYEYSQTRTPGPAAMLSVESRLSGRFRLRLDGELSYVYGVPAPAGQLGGWNDRDLRTYGASANGVLRITERRVAPYLLAGAGAYRLQFVGGEPNPYGTTGTVQVGIGVDGNFWNRVNPFVEARYQVHLTDYGAAEFTATGAYPLLIGLRVR